MPNVQPQTLAAPRRGGASVSLALTLTIGWATVVLADAAVPAPLAWQEGAGYRWAELPLPATGRAGFRSLPPERTGVTFTNHLAELSSAVNRILENGSGVALGDVDGDGWCDLYLCRLEGANVLYRNLGDWRFADITAAAGVACPDQYSTGAAFADVDGDGDLDLLVNALGAGTRQFLNDGEGRFVELTGTRLVRRFGSTSLALADIDADGDLDLYVTNYRTTTYNDRPPGVMPEARMVDGKIVVTPADRFVPVVPHSGGVEVIELGERDFLYLNDGRGRFAPVSWTSGSFLDESGQSMPQPPLDWGLSVFFRDFNQDGTPDIYVCNDFFYSRDRFWLNHGSRFFRALPALAQRRISVSSMGLDVADIDRDGHDDFFVSDMVSRRHSWRQRQRPNLMQGLVNQALEDPQARPEVAHNTLFLNRGDGTYAEIAQLAGVDGTEWSWGAVFLDVDLDGYEDLLIPTGNNHDVQDADVLRAQRGRRGPNTLADRLREWREFPVLATPILGYRNNGDLTFTERSGDWGFSEPGPWQGMACADLDRDGDLDLVVNRLNGAAGLFRNESVAPRLAVRLRGQPPNTRGVGARLEVAGGPVPQSQEMQCGGRYLSSDDTVRMFAAGPAPDGLRIQVHWRSGQRSAVERAQPNRLYEVDEPAGAAGPSPATSPTVVPVPRPWFADVSDRLDHADANEPYDDFGRQGLLSRKLSPAGPGAAWFDTNGDGWDDLILGGGRGRSVSVWRNDGAGNFRRDTNAAVATLTDTTTVLGLYARADRPVLIAGSSTYATPRTNPAAARLIDLRRALVSDLPGTLAASPGPLALADVDGDGDLDLFVGGRVRPGYYPEPVDSRLYRNAGDASFGPDPANEGVLAKIGLVNGATFSDLDGDGMPELLLAREWGGLGVLRNQAGRFRVWNPPLVWSRPPRHLPPASRLDQLTGWWQGIATGDFDGDGRLDVVASNWGRNTRFERYLARPLRIYYGDLTGAGGGDLVEAYFEPELEKWVPWRSYEAVGRAFPFLVEAAPTFQAYGEASVDELFGDRLAHARRLEAVTLDSVLLLNRGDQFEVRPLPVEAQFAPGFGLGVGDFDGDGCEDLLLSQNFFSVEQETSRYDGGVGLCLRGDGRGNFVALRPKQSGLSAAGQQRACALCDFDADGRVDVALTQHGWPTKLYRNQHAQPGLRVRLEGPPENPLGLGAILRLESGGRLGPARELRAGSGYWSQDSAVAVLARPAEPAQLHVRWPGGKTTIAPVHPGATEVRVAAER